MAWQLFIPVMHIIIRSDHKSDDTCLMVDNTDFPKTGRRMENIGRVHSHLEHRSILEHIDSIVKGFKLHQELQAAPPKKNN